MSAQQSEAQNRWTGAPGHFLLRYSLWADKKVSLSALRHKVLQSGKLGKQVAPAPHKILSEPDLPAVDRSTLEALHTLHFKEMATSYYWSGVTKSLHQRVEVEFVDHVGDEAG